MPASGGSGSGGPDASEPERPAAGQAEAAPPDGRAASGGAARAADAGGSEDGEAILWATMIGWPVFGQDGGEVDDVIVLQDTGAVDGVLVEVGGFLGTGLGGHLVRIDLDELRIDAADEALIAAVSAADITGRESYAGPELQP